MPARKPHAKIFLTIAVALLCLISLASCGSEPASPVTITLTAGTVGKEFQVLQKQVAQFEAEHPDIQVQLIDPPESTDDRHEAYVEDFKSKDPTIDVYMIDIIWQPEFGAAGWTLSLNDYVAEKGINMDEMLSSPIRSNTWNGNLVSMPWFTDAGLLYYRKDLLTRYNRPVPETWAELVETAKIVVEGEKEGTPGIVGFVFQGRQYEGLTTNYLEYVWGNGAEVLDVSGQQVLLNTPEAVEALEILIDMQEISAPGITSFQEPDAINYFHSGNAVFMRNWPFAWAVLNDTPEMKDKVGVAALPHGPQVEESVSALGGWQLAINAYSHHPDEAFELIDFLTSPEQQAYKAIEAGQAPTRLDVYSDLDVLKANPHFATLFDVLTKAKPRLIHPRYQDISVVIQQEVYQALKGNQDAAKATTCMAAAIQAIIDSSPQEESP